MNTTPLVEKAIPELRIDAGELTVIRHKLVHEKVALQAQIVEVNSKLSHKLLPPVQYHKLSAHRTNIVNALMAKERELADINAARIEVETVLDNRKRQAFGEPQIRELIAMRDRWHEFSMEKANPQKAREVAFKCSQELRAILKPYFDARTD